MSQSRPRRVSREGDFGGSMEPSVSRAFFMATARVYWSRETGGTSGDAHGMPLDHGTRFTVISLGQSSRSIILSEDAILNGASLTASPLFCGGLGTACFLHRRRTQHSEEIHVQPRSLTPSSHSHFCWNCLQLVWRSPTPGSLAASPCAHERRWQVRALPCVTQRGHRWHRAGRRHGRALSAPRDCF